MEVVEGARRGKLEVIGEGDSLLLFWDGGDLLFSVEGFFFIGIVC